MKRVLAFVLSFAMAFSVTTVSLPVDAAAKNTVKTSITKVESKAKGFKVTWKKKSKIKGYQIQYSTSSKFKKSSTKSKTISKAKTKSATISKLKGCNVKYYVRVRTYKISKGKKIYSSWSKVKKVTTLKHKYSKATCTKAKTCKYCKKTSGKAIGHKWGGKENDYAKLNANYLLNHSTFESKLSESYEIVENCQKAINTARSDLYSLSPTCPEEYRQEYLNNWQAYGSTYAAMQAAQSAWSQTYNSQRVQLNNAISMNTSRMQAEQTNIKLYSVVISNLETQYKNDVRAVKIKHGIKSVCNLCNQINQSEAYNYLKSWLFDNGNVYGNRIGIQEQIEDTVFAIEYDKNSESIFLHLVEPSTIACVIDLNSNNEVYSCCSNMKNAYIIDGKISAATYKSYDTLSYETYSGDASDEQLFSDVHSSSVNLLLLLFDDYLKQIIPELSITDFGFTSFK